MTTAPQAYRGQRLGLPSAGSGSLASTGSRLLAFLVDAVASTLVAALFVHGATHTGNALVDRLPGNWAIVPLVVDYLVGTLAGGRTLGMYLVGLRLIRAAPSLPIGLWRAVVRTLLLLMLVPAVVFDRDGRGLHDRVSETAVVRA